MSTVTLPVPSAALAAHAAEPVYLLRITAAPGQRTVADGALWNGVLNSTADDDIDGPSPVESLMAAVGGCLVRNIAAMAERARIPLDLLELDIAATRSDEPPAITYLVVDTSISSKASFERVRHVVELAVRYGTISRTLARACPIRINLSINGAPAVLDVDALLSSTFEENL